MPSGATFRWQPGSVPALLDTALGPTGAFGSIIPGSAVPDGTAFAVRNTYSVGSFRSSMIFEFAFEQDRVGMYATLTGGATSDVLLSAYDSANALVETVSIPAVSIANWKTNFIGIENPGRIRWVEIYSEDSVGLVVDRVTFEGVTPVPEPSAMVLSFIGLATIPGALRRRRTPA